MTILFELAIIAANLALCSVLNLRRIYESYPRLYGYVFFQAFAAAASLIVYVTHFSVTYVITYYMLIFFGGICAAMTAGELSGKLLGPRGALPAWVTARLLIFMGTGMAAALTAAGVFYASRGGNITRALMTAEQWMSGALWVAFSVILIFWRTLKVFRRQTRAASICLGFVLYFTVSIFAVFVRGHKVPAELTEAAKHAGMIAYLIMLLWWTGVLLMPAPVFEKATAEQKEQVLDEFEQTQQAAGRVAIASR
ncbi:MAG TPA: hypothetical protein VGQ12_07835 [Candidatus Angelobacter sp.]|nr:hypothetical protein [Candidatus Angelobacter sp.]